MHPSAGTALALARPWRGRSQAYCAYDYEWQRPMAWRLHRWSTTALHVIIGYEWQRPMAEVLAAFYSFETVTNAAINFACHLEV
jgi:hypothetical protein